MPPRRRRTIRTPNRGNTRLAGRPGQDGEIQGTLETKTQYIVPGQKMLYGSDVDQEAIRSNAASGVDIGKDAHRPELTPMTPGSPVDSSLLENNSDDQDAPENKASSDSELGSDEASAASGIKADKASKDELSALPETEKPAEPSLYSGGKEDDKRGGKARNLLRLSRNIKRGRLLMAGGGALTGLAILFGGLFGSFEAIHVRENMLTKGNSLVNEVLEDRRGRSLARTLRQMNKDDFRKRINTEKMANKFRSQGFTVDFDTNGKLTNFGFTDPSSGEFRALDLNDTDYRRAARGFFGREAGDFGRRASHAFDSASGIRAVTWKGRAARRVYGKLGVTLDNWADKARNKSMGEAMKEADASDTKSLQTNANTNLADADGDGQITEADGNREVVADYASELPDKVQTAAEAAEAGRDISAAVDVNEDMADLLTPEIEDLMATGDDTTSALGNLRNSLSSAFPRLAGRLDRVAAAANLGEVPRIACRIKGTLNFVSDVRNVYLSAELAVFAVRFLTVADHQKAGLISSSGTKMMMDYLHTPSPITGKTYTNDGGFQNIVFGNTDAKPSPANMGRYATGRGDMGILGSIRNFINGIPLTGDRTCQTVNNGFFQLGAAVVSVGAAFMSGTTVTVGTVAASIGLGVLEEVAFAIATPLIVKSVTGTVISGFEDGHMAGGALGSGFGVLSGMNASGNGTRAATKAKAAVVRQQAEESAMYAKSQQSIFERYLDPYESDSLVTRMAFAMPRQKETLRNTLGQMAQFLNPATLLGRLPATGASAQSEEDQCLNDPQISDLDLATDVYCNVKYVDVPDLDLDVTEQVLMTHQATRKTPLSNGRCLTETVDAPLIDSLGKGIDYPDGDAACDGQIHMSDDLNDYIEYCHSGRAGQLYDTSDPSKVLNGSTTAPKASLKMHDPFTDYEDPCVKDGEPLANEIEGIGRFARYTAWYGYQTDEDNFIEDINEQYDDNPAAVNPAPSTDIPAGLPEGDIKGIAAGLVNSSNIIWRNAFSRSQTKTVADTGQGEIDHNLIRYVSALTQKHKISISSMRRCTAGIGAGTRSLHCLGKAVDISGTGGVNGTTFDYNGHNPTVQQFLIDAAALMPSGGCEIGVPNSQYVNATRPHTTCSVFVDKGTAPHIHLGVKE